MSFEKFSADSSFPCVFRSCRRGSAISMSCIFATRSAKSKAIFGSIIPEESTRVDLASAALTKISYVSLERAE